METALSIVAYAHRDLSSCAAAQLGGNIGGELFLYVDDNPDSHQNLIITFWPIYNGP